MMKKAFVFVSVFLVFLSGLNGKLLPLFAAQYDYQNYNHGYYPECDRCGCNPCCCGETSVAESAPDQLPPPTPPPCSTPCEAPCAAATCGTGCGMSMCALGIAIAALCAAAAIIVSSGNGAGHNH